MVDIYYKRIFNCVLIYVHQSVTGQTALIAKVSFSVVEYFLMLVKLMGEITDRVLNFFEVILY